MDIYLAIIWLYDNSIINGSDLICTEANGLVNFSLMTNFIAINLWPKPVTFPNVNFLTLLLDFGNCTENKKFKVLLF